MQDVTEFVQAAIVMVEPLLNTRHLLTEIYLVNVLRGSGAASIIHAHKSFKHYGALKNLTKPETTKIVQLMFTNNILHQYFINNNVVPNAYIKFGNKRKLDKDEKIFWPIKASSKVRCRS